MIFIIDDDVSIRRAYKNLLNSADYDCECYSSAEDFLARKELNDSDLIILDIKMPGMSGTDLLKELSARGNKNPIIIVSAFIDNIVNQAAKDYGVIAVLRKPVDGEALIDLIKFNSRNETFSAIK